MGLCASADEKDDPRESYEKVTPCPDVTPPEVMVRARAASTPQVEFNRPAGNMGVEARAPRGAGREAYGTVVTTEEYERCMMQHQHHAAAGRGREQPGMDMHGDGVLRPPALPEGVPLSRTDSVVSASMARRPRRGGRRADSVLIQTGAKPSDAEADKKEAAQPLRRRATYSALPRARGGATLSGVSAADQGIAHPPVTADTKKFKKFAIVNNLTVDLLCMGAAPGNPATCHAPPPRGTRPPSKPFAAAPPAVPKYTKQAVAPAPAAEEHAHTNTNTEMGLRVLEKLSAEKGEKKPTAGGAANTEMGLKVLELMKKDNKSAEKDAPEADLPAQLPRVGSGRVPMRRRSSIALRPLGAKQPPTPEEMLRHI
eukprot:TRINITY_DN8238_c0_g1_i1.p1 TRINITY_DN8238_c0_g1~~TRINITY_DN8238_c0_g1_i1.p1  ORF type:complete len:370 (+),score=135.70 TRINITY_DN8238_c0_g1_i1:54-1163(+)